ncbi:MAG: hypothetical protein JW776_14690 [Candidatus Lokiarchaeota archaeon]|nr:hypothetical protein [Candidatus Lokiarchaeota archaeon]
MKGKKQKMTDEEEDWLCEFCGEKNASDAIICECCGQSRKLDSYSTSTMNSRKFEHEEFRKRFWKFRNQHPDMVRKFTRIVKEEMESMLSPSGDVKIDDVDVPELSAEEIIRMSMTLGMSCDEVLDMMIEQSKNYN